MAKPTDDISWATDANYPAGPETYAATPTTTEPVTGRKAEGWEPGKKPPAQEMNWWQNAIYRFLTWVFGLFDSNGRLLQLAESTTKWRPATSGGALLNAGTITTPDLGDSYFVGDATPFSAIVGLPVDVAVGDVITSIAFLVYGDGVAAAAMQLYPLDGSVSAIETVDAPTAAAAWTVYTQVLGSPYTVLAGVPVMVTIAATSNATKVRAYAVTSHTPSRKASP